MNFLKRCWQRRWLRGLTWTAVTFVTFYALLCAWVNWSGARQWRATQAMLKAEGETHDFRATLNEPIPEAENFCAIPLLKDLALIVDNDYGKGAPGANRKRLETVRLRSAGKGDTLPKLTSPALGKRTDFKEWADWLRKEGSRPMPVDSGDAARDVLAALAKHDEIVQELAAGLDRPQAQWTPEWKTRELPQLMAETSLPHTGSAQDLSRILALRAIAAARTGDAAKAHEAAVIIARLSQACLNEPNLIGLLVSASGTTMLHGTTWELCAAHAGTTEDFAGLESALATLDFRRSALHAWRSELAAMAGDLQCLKERRDDILGLFRMFISSSQSEPSAADRLMRLVPAGFFDANSAVFVDLEFRRIIKPLKEPGWQQAFASGRDLENELIAMKTKVWTHPSYLFASMFVPASSQVISRCAYAHALVNQAMVACALERWRIRNGTYPASLDAVRLAGGNPLPPDPMNGQPLHYRQTADRRYALWSVGFDGKDDGGKRTLHEKKPEDTKFHEAAYVGDWVWDFPADLQ